MPHVNADHNLLFGILALQMDFIDREALIEAMNAWVLTKARPLGQILLEKGALAEDEHVLLAALVAKHLAKHHHDPQQSLAAISSLGSVRKMLDQVVDPDLHASLLHLPPAAPVETDPYATRPPSVGDLTSAGLRFHILRPHARGGLGEVFVARDVELHREVALKEIQERHADHPQSRSRFLVEAEITGQLEHPGIVPVYGLGQYADGRPFYAMRFIRGDSLKEAIERFHDRERTKLDPGERALELRQLLGRFIDVCDAIAYAHSRGVLHRDLKPGNIMIGKYGETLVVDWGLAKLVGKVESVEGPLVPSSASGSALTLMGQAVGTPQYMSPEQAAGQLDRLGPTTDVYSLGATLYCLLTGKAPFEDRDVGVVMRKVQRGDFPPPRQLNRSLAPALEAICLKAMACLPEHRYPAARALAEDLEHWLADEPVTAYREPWTRRLARWRRRHPTLVTATALVLLTVLASGVLGAGLLGREKARARALAQVEALMDASPATVPLLLTELEPRLGDVSPRLREKWNDPQLTGSQRLRIGLTLVPDAAEEVRDRLVDLVQTADDPRDVLLVRDALAPYREAVRARLWERVKGPTLNASERFRLLALLATLDPEDAGWPAWSGAVVEQFLAANPLHLGPWVEALRPIRSVLVEPLAVVFRGRQHADKRQVAASILADYAADRPDILVGLIVDADERQFTLLRPGVRLHRERASSLLQGILQQPLPPEDQISARDVLARQQALAAVTLLQLGQAEPVWPLLRRGPDPSRRTYLIHALGPLGTNPESILQRLEQEPDVGARQALILSLGEYNGDQLTEERRQAALDRLLGWYRTDPDPGLHGAIDWLLRHGEQGPAKRKLDWRHALELNEIDQQLAGQAPAAKNWYVTRTQGHTMAVAPAAGVFRMGSPAYEPGRYDTEARHSKRIARSFAIGTKKVTIRQFKVFLGANPGVASHALMLAKEFGSDEEGPVQGVSWYEAAQYCRWLSEREGIAEDQMCYPPVDQIKEGMKLPADYLRRTGYRLPTEAEWEYACRAGTETGWTYGMSPDTIGQYGWYVFNSHDRAWPVGQLKPNDLGLFDVHGNVWEWCHDRRLFYPKGPPGLVHEDKEETNLQVTDTDIRVWRGGSFQSRLRDVRTASRNGGLVRNPSSTIGTGLRVARTYR